jgi:hypothetical protein
MPSFQDMLAEQRTNTETQRVGLKWDSEEDFKMLEMIGQNYSFEDIAKTLQRTPGSIKTRLIVNAMRKMDSDNISMEDATTMFGLGSDDIAEYNTKKEERDKKRRTMQRSPKMTKVVTNNQIYDLLHAISNKMDSLSKI